MQSDVIFSRLKIWCKMFLQVTNRLKYVTLLHSFTSDLSQTKLISKVLCSLHDPSKV